MKYSQRVNFIKTCTKGHLIDIFTRFIDDTSNIPDCFVIFFRNLSTLTYLDYKKSSVYFKNSMLEFLTVVFIPKCMTYGTIFYFQLFIFNSFKVMFNWYFLLQCSFFSWFNMRMFAISCLIY